MNRRRAAGRHQPEYAEVLDGHVILGRAERKPAPRIGLGIVQLEQLLSVPPVLDQVAERDELDLLRDVWFQQDLRITQIVLRKQWTVVFAADVAPKAGGRIGVPAQADVVAAELVVVSKLSAARDVEHAVRAA